MRICLVNQFYPPDVAPTGAVLQDLARGLVARGHEVSVCCSARDYGGGCTYAGGLDADGVEIHRVRAFGFGRRTHVGRLLDYASFLVGLWARIRRLAPRPDLFVVLTTPPYVGLLVGWAASGKRIPCVHWIMDLYPDVLSAHGMLSDTGWPYRFLTRLSRREFQISSWVLTLSHEMSERASRYVATGKGDLVGWIPLWANAGLGPCDGDGVASLRRERGWEGDVVLQYSGNLGLGHRFQEFLDAALVLSSDVPVRWVFAGGGRRMPKVVEWCAEHPAAKVEVLSYVPRDRLNCHLAAADVHLVSLDARWQGCIAPSKLQAAFKMSRPVIFVGAAAGETADWVREAGAGWVVPEGDVDALVTAVRQACDPAERARRGAAAARLSRERFDRDANVTQICEKLEQIGESRSSPADGA